MNGSAIPRVMSKHPGPQPSPEISHYDYAMVNCTQKKAWRPLDGDLESSDFMRRELRQFVWIYLRRKQAIHVIPAVYIGASCIFLWETHLVTNNSDTWFLPFLCQMGRV